MGTKDGIVQDADLRRAVAEVDAVPPKEMAARIAEIEPMLVRFIDNEVYDVVGRLVSEACEKRIVISVSTEMRRIALTAVRAMQHGYYTLWRDLFNDDGSVVTDPHEGGKK